MTDLTCQVIINAASHDLSANPEIEAQRYRNGDIVAVYDTDTMADLVLTEYKVREPVGSKRMGFVHVTDVPVDKVAQFKKVLAGPIKPVAEIYRRRKFRIVPGVMPPLVKDELLLNKEITVTFTQLKAMTRKKSIVDIADASLDDETAPLTDADL